MSTPGGALVTMYCQGSNSGPCMWKACILYLPDPLLVFYELSFTGFGAVAKYILMA